MGKLAGSFPGIAIADRRPVEARSVDSMVRKATSVGFTQTPLGSWRSRPPRSCKVELPGGPWLLRGTAIFTLVTLMIARPPQRLNSTVVITGCSRRSSKGGCADFLRESRAGSQQPCCAPSPKECLLLRTARGEGNGSGPRGLEIRAAEGHWPAMRAEWTDRTERVLGPRLDHWKRGNLARVGKNRADAPGIASTGFGGFVRKGGMARRALYHTDPQRPIVVPGISRPIPLPRG